MTMRIITAPESDGLNPSTSECLLRQLYPLRMDSPRPQRRLGRGELLIGREVDPQKGLRLEGRQVSGLHARVVKRKSGYLLRDAGSTNGTYVNLQRIEEHQLRSGDVIRIGGTLLIYLEEAQCLYPSYPEIQKIIAGNSASVRELRHQLAQLATRNESVLLLGETGTGKELAAEALHVMSRRPGSLVAVNCAAISPDLAESMLFGHLRGAFSGATRDHAGYFRDADQGTLLLDELGEMQLDLQPKVLRALETKNVKPVGSSTEERVDVRVIGATNRDLRVEIDNERFRLDLHARFPYKLRLPPLRERREDILPLFAQFLGKPVNELPVRKAFALLVYPWPQNVRELLNAAKNASLLGIGADNEDISRWVEHLRPLATTPSSEDKESETALALRHSAKPPVSEAILRNRLIQENGIQARVAKALGRSVRQVKRLFEKFRLNPQDFKAKPQVPDKRPRADAPKQPDDSSDSQDDGGS